MSKTLYITIISYVITSYHGINACTTANCVCSGTNVICSNRQLTSVPDGIEANATRLMLSRNRLIAIDGSDFSGLAELERLDLDNNEIVSITADAFQDLISLKFIYLNDNQITSLPSGLFSANVILQNVYVNDNNLTTVSADVFQAITRITTIQLTENLLVCCTMTDLLIWKHNQSSLSDGTFKAMCYDFNTETDIHSFDSSNCSIVAGQWSMWINSSCSVTCGDGIITRTRTCDNPAPSDGGDDCFGSSNETVQCNVDPCRGSTLRPELKTLVISLVLGISAAVGITIFIILISLKISSLKKVKNKSTDDISSVKKHHKAWT
ncbi:uncharacterized protein LOC143064089 isoform X1 [Mytilus galloprovincialis]|uniref:uncharacterized protein LOC143064089 isoform X1 n=1 Tax=Mytilus galloprovincialis TaxID=29158 RepID=UPI003F7CBFA9